MGVGGGDSVCMRGTERGRLGRTFVRVGGCAWFVELSALIPLLVIQAYTSGPTLGALEAIRGFADDTMHIIM